MYCKTPLDTSIESLLPLPVPEFGFAIDFEDFDVSQFKHVQLSTYNSILDLKQLAALTCRHTYCQNAALLSFLSENVRATIEKPIQALDLQFAHIFGLEKCKPDTHDTCLRSLLVCTIKHCNTMVSSLHLHTLYK